MTLCIHADRSLLLLNRELQLLRHVSDELILLVYSQALLARIDRSEGLRR